MNLDHILEQRGLEFKVTSDQLVMACPLCLDHKPRLYIDPQSGLWICHNCDVRGNMLTLFEQVAGYDPIEAYHLVQKIQPRRVTRKDHVGPEPKVDLPPGFVLLDDPDSPRERLYWRYLDERGLSAEEIEAYRLGYTLIGKPAYRVIIPVIERGEVRGWIARAIRDDQRPKVINAPGMESGRLLYNIDAVVDKPDIVVVEGPFDAMALPYRAVATMGAKMSAFQRGKLRLLTKNITMMWDTDDAGIKATVKTVPELLMAGFNVRLAILREGSDPGNAGLTRNGMALRNALPVEPDWTRRKIRQVLEDGRKAGW